MMIARAAQARQLGLQAAPAAAAFDGTLRTAPAIPPRCCAAQHFRLTAAPRA
jgi:hypothetical protein